MPRRKASCNRSLSPDGTHAIKIVPNAKQIEIINRLLEEGLHGNTASQVINRIFCEGCIPHATQPANVRT